MARTRIRTGAIEVEGLRDLQRALKQVEGDLPGEIRDLNREVAEDVLGKAEGRAHSIGGVAAHVAPSLSVSATKTSAGVAGGGPSSPAFGGAEFGAVNYPQFGPWTGSGSDAGYFLYPAIRDEAPHITEKYTERLNDITRRAGL